MQSIEEHPAAFNAVKAYCQAQDYGNIDIKPKNINCLCFISHDPHAILKEAEPLAWELPVLKNNSIPQTVPTTFHPTDTKRLQSALDAIPADDYEIWIEIGCALYHSEIADSEAFVLWDGFDPSTDEATAKEQAAEQIRKRVKSEWQIRRAKPQIKAAVQTMKQAAHFTPEELTEFIDSGLPRLKFTNAVDLFNTEFEPLQFAVPNLIPEGLTILAGPPKIGKSFLCLNFALAIASGGVAAGSIPIEQPQNVLYCAIEDSKRRIKERIATLAPDPNRLHFLTQGELPTVLDEAGISILDEAAEANKIDVIIIDTWQRVKPSRSKRENGTIYEEDYELLGKLQAWAIKKRLSVVVHHLRKTTDEDNPFNQISGSTGIQAAVDSILMLTRKDGSYLLSVTGRDFEEQELGLDFTDGHWTIREKPKLSFYRSSARKSSPSCKMPMKP